MQKKKLFKFEKEKVRPEFLLGLVNTPVKLIHIDSPLLLIDITEAE